MTGYKNISFLIIGYALIINPISLSSQVTFMKNIGGTGDEEGKHIIVTTDGGYAVAGWTNSYGSGGKDGYIVKLDAFGNLIWNKTVGDVSDDEFNHIIQTTDGGYVAVGSTQSFGNGGEDKLIVRLDANGNLLWTRSFGNIGDDEAYSVIETTTGELIVVGSHDGQTEANVIKITLTGNLVWSIRFGGPGNDWVKDVVENGLGYLMIGTAFTFAGASQSEAFFIQMDFNGNILWHQSFGGIGAEQLSTIRPSNTGQYLVSDGSRSWNNGKMGVYLAELAPSGAIQWSKTYGIAGKDLAGHAIPLPNGGNIIGVEDQTIGIPLNAYLIKTTNSGSVLWSNEYGGMGDDVFKLAIPAPDGGLIAVGYSNSFSIGSDKDIFLVKTDVNGNVQCHQATANFVEQLVFSMITPISPTTSFLGNGSTVLPNLTTPMPVTATQCINNLLPVAQFSINNPIICPNDCINLTNLSTNNPQSYEWEFVSANIPNSTLQNPSNICFPTAGTYDIRLITHNLYGSDTAIQQILVLPQPTVDLGVDTVMCDNESLFFDVTTSNVTYLWSNGKTTPTLTIQNGGDYWVEVNNGACKVRDSISISLVTSPFINLGLDSTFCEGESFTLVAGQPNMTYLWQDSSTNPIYTATTTGMHWVEVNNGTCESRDSVQLTFLPFPQLDLGNDTAYCNYDTLVLNASANHATSYLWHNGSTDTLFTPVNSATYWAEATNVKCTIRDSINITIWDIPQVDLGEDTSLCERDTLILEAIYPNAVPIWQNGSTAPTFPVTLSGVYTVKLVDVSTQCFVFDDIVVSSLAAPLVDLGADAALCEGDSLNVATNILLLNANHVWQDSSNLSNYTITNTGLYSVTVSYDYSFTTCVVEDSIFVEVVPNPVVDLGIDTTLCNGDEFELKPLSATTYTWQDGSTDSIFTVKEAGTYFVSLSDENQCFGTDTIVFDYLRYLEPTLLTDTMLCAEQTVTFDASQPDVESYLWTGQSAYARENDYESPFFLVTFPGWYQVEMANQCNTIVQEIFVEKDDCTCTPFVPNAFTPNNDGQNDFFEIYPTCQMDDFYFAIFDRWGNKVFDTEEVGFSWDGTKNGVPLSTGVYIWVTRYKGLDRVGDTIEHRLSGDVTVLK